MAEHIMVPVQTAEEIKRERRIIKDAYGSVVTNFTVLPAEYESWVKEASIYQVAFDRCTFFIHQTARGYDVFFFADSYQSVQNALPELKKHLTQASIIESLQRNTESLIGFPLMILQRMSSTEIPIINSTKETGTELCYLNDLGNVEDILLRNFNPIAERIPTISQLETLASNPQNGGIYVAKNDNKITGLMVYSIDKTTIHLRYWWTDPQYRNQGIGSRLLNRFFNLGRDCQRMILWVRTDNEEAIKRYKHYGFVPEQMYDLIYKIR